MRTCHYTWCSVETVIATLMFSMLAQPGPAKTVCPGRFQPRHTDTPTGQSSASGTQADQPLLSVCPSWSLVPGSLLSRHLLSSGRSQSPVAHTRQGKAFVSSMCPPYPGPLTVCVRIRLPPALRFSVFGPRVVIAAVLYLPPGKADRRVWDLRRQPRRGGQRGSTQAMGSRCRFVHDCCNMSVFMSVVVWVTVGPCVGCMIRGFCVRRTRRASDGAPD